MSLLYIGLGGFLGACFRYLNGDFLTGLLDHCKVPYPTLLTNLLACFIFGMLFPLAEHYSWFSENFLPLRVRGVLNPDEQHPQHQKRSARDALYHKIFKVNKIRQIPVPASVNKEPMPPKK